MFLNNLDNRVLVILMALAIVIALVVFAAFVLDVPQLSALSTNIYEIAGESTCSGCVSSG